ncbi:MAG: aldehyde dehydrogenase family protein [Spirochaetota bacterium]
MQVLNTSDEKINEIYQAQKEYKFTLYKSTLRERLGKLDKLLNQIRESTPEIKQALYLDFKKPYAESDINEIIPVIGELNHAITHLKSWMSPETVGTPVPLIGSKSEIQYEPKGQVLIISPWNYPFFLCLTPVVAAIAAGNTMIVKPSEYAPHTAILIEKIVSDLFAKEEVAVVQGEVAVSQTLLSLRHDHIFFTGSTQVGRIVMQAAAKHLTPVTLELGGKSPVLVDEYADFREAAVKIAWGKFINCGQTCVAPDYVLIPEEKKGVFLQHLTTALSSMYGKESQAWQKSKDYARIINGKQFQRLVALLEEAKQAGAKVEIGGHSDAEENYLAPTVLSQVPLEVSMMQEEIFGPLLPIVTYESLQDAIQFINEREKPLALYAFTSREMAADKILRETSSGGTCINDVVIHLGNPHLPFGGIGESGMGNYHGIHGFKTFSHVRAVLRQVSPINTIELLYPPYDSPMKGIAKNVVKNLV